MPTDPPPIGWSFGQTGPWFPPLVSPHPLPSRERCCVNPRGLSRAPVVLHACAVCVNTGMYTTTQGLPTWGGEAKEGSTPRQRSPRGRQGGSRWGPRSGTPLCEIVGDLERWRETTSFLAKANCRHHGLLGFRHINTLHPTVAIVGWNDLHQDGSLCSLSRAS